MTKPKSWWVGLLCHNCGRPVKVSDPKGGASFHMSADGIAWAEHHVCPPPKGKR